MADKTSDHGKSLYDRLHAAPPSAYTDPAKIAAANQAAIDNTGYTGLVSDPKPSPPPKGASGSGGSASSSNPGGTGTAPPASPPVTTPPVQGKRDPNIQPPAVDMPGWNSPTNPRPDDFTSGPSMPMVPGPSRKPHLPPGLPSRALPAVGSGVRNINRGRSPGGYHPPDLAR